MQTFVRIIPEKICAFGVKNSMSMYYYVKWVCIIIPTKLFERVSQRNF